MLNLAYPRSYSYSNLHDNVSIVDQNKQRLDERKQMRHL